ncbi:MAG: zinc ribbon domain-containing protein [Anaerocolumna sp.]
MVCKACGRNTANDNANYCEYCGTSFRENIPVKQEEYRVVSEPASVEVNNEENEKPISFGNWLGTMLLPFIPIIGIFIYIVMMFVWAFGSDTTKSKKNWARASLIISVVAIILFIFMFASTMMDIMNSGMNLQDYMNQLYQ